MKIQISFEVMVYFAIAGLALLFGLTVLASEWHIITESIDSYSLYIFVSSVNADIENGASAFQVYVPQGACNSTIHNNAMGTQYGTFYFLDMIRVANSAFCPDGRYSDLIANYSNGVWVIG